jgi:hypothetical protein
MGGRQRFFADPAPENDAGGPIETEPPASRIVSSDYRIGEIMKLKV